MKDHWRKKIKSILIICVCFIGLNESIHAQFSNNIIIKDTIDHLPLRTQILNQRLNVNQGYDFNNSHYRYKAFFCRLEDKMFKKTKKNIRFRLGSLDYVNKLESK